MKQEIRKWTKRTFEHKESSRWSMEEKTVQVHLLPATFTALLHWEEDVWVAECPEVGTVSQGETIEEAVAMLREATELFIEEVKRLGYEVVSREDALWKAKQLI